MGDDEIEECLMKVVEIFNYVTDKDLFAEQYRCAYADSYESPASSSWHNGQRFKTRFCRGHLDIETFVSACSAAVLFEFCF